MIVEILLEQWWNLETILFQHDKKLIDTSRTICQEFWAIMLIVFRDSWNLPFVEVIVAHEKPLIVVSLTHPLHSF